MAKITYTDKEAMNIDPSIPAKNKCMADDLNEIKNVVNINENKTLLAISDTAPSQCTTGDLYYNTTSNKIFTATATDTWSSTGEEPTENTLYLYDNTIYSYDGTTLVVVGGKSEISISTTTPVDPDNELKLWINPNEMANIGGGGGEKGIVLYSTTATEVINANNRNNGNITVLNAGQYYKFGIGYERVTGGLIGYTEFLFDKENFDDMYDVVTLKIDRVGTTMSSGTGEPDKYTLSHMIHSRNVYLRGSQYSLQPSGSISFYSNDYRNTGDSGVGGGHINSVGYTTTYYDDNGTITVNPAYPTVEKWDLYTDLQNTSFNSNDIIITKIIGFKK